MPHKNGNCPKCGRKLKHKEWLSEVMPSYAHISISFIADPNRIRQRRTLRCPGCDYETRDTKTRSMATYIKWRKKIDAK